MYKSIRCDWIIREVSWVLIYSTHIIYKAFQEYFCEFWVVKKKLWVPQKRTIVFSGVVHNFWKFKKFQKTKTITYIVYQRNTSIKTSWCLIWNAKVWLIFVSSRRVFLRRERREMWSRSISPATISDPWTDFRTIASRTPYVLTLSLFWFRSLSFVFVSHSRRMRRSLCVFHVYCVESHARTRSRTVDIPESFQE